MSGEININVKSSVLDIGNLITDANNTHKDLEKLICHIDSEVADFEFTMNLAEKLLSSLDDEIRKGVVINPDIIEDLKKIKKLKTELFSYYSIYEKHGVI